MNDNDNKKDNSVINTAVDVGKKIVISKILKKALAIILPVALPVIGVVLIVSLLIAIIVMFIPITSSSDNIAMGGYYPMRCPEVTVIFTDKQSGYRETGTKTYLLEDYVAGVVAGEVGFLGSTELDKAFAVAARSYLYANDNDCTIESSDRKQVFRELTSSSTDQQARKAAEATKGKVLLSNGNVYGSQYDAFACVASDNNYYTISQGNQKIPKAWIESKINSNNQSNWFVCNGKENLINHHGNGMSQYGGLYLASELNYTYEEILGFYFQEQGIRISADSLVSSIPGLSVKNTTNSQNLTGISLNDYLKKRGSSINNLNSYISQSVAKAGKGTRAGVVTAAVSLVNYLYDNFNIRIPYYWGGYYQNYGVNPNFGNKVGASCSSTACYYYDGFDCSGFVSWAIRNGGYKIGRNTTVEFHNQFSRNSCNIRENTCIGQPGDLINSRNLHVMMIVAVNQESGKYMVAESTGGYGLIIREWPIHQDMWGNDTRVLLMDNYYKNSGNVG